MENWQNHKIKKISDFLQNHVRLILDSLTDGIIITDEQCIVYYINPAYTMFSGLYLNDMAGKHLADVRPGAVLPKVLKTLQPISNIPRRVGNVESYCDFLPLINQDTLVGGMVIVKDVARVKQLTKQLEESNEKILQLDKRFKDAFKAKFTFEDIVGSGGSMKKVVEMCHKAARADSPVLLIGESGTGKEVIAQAIHNESDRAGAPFVGVNCAALPEHLLESELFGYEGGAFSGARKTGKLGWFEIANGGTLFLDEITELPLNLQSKLLRVLQEQQIARVGGEKTIQLDVRVVAATNRDIGKMVHNGDFRDDLYFRLAVFVIDIPPLRDRGADILLLANRFVEEQQRRKKHVITLSNEVMDILQNYEWPGNIREIKNVIEYACNVTDDYLIKPQDIPQTIIRADNLQKAGLKNRRGISLEKILNDVEKSVLENYLKLYGDNLEAKKKIAGELGVSIATLYNKLKKYRL